MIAALLLTLQSNIVPGAPALPPQDWSTLPSLRYARPIGDDATLANFVRGEVKAGRCGAVRQMQGMWVVAVDVAVLVQLDGSVRRTIPRAINCPAVEQYAAGIVSSRARGNVDTDGRVADTWYRTTLNFSWR